MLDKEAQLTSANGTHCLRFKNTLKQGKFLKYFKVTAKPTVLENVKRSWKKS